VLAIDFQVQEKLFAEVPQMERYFRIMMQRAMAASQLRLKLIYQLSKEEMYKHFSTSFPQFFAARAAIHAYFVPRSSPGIPERIAKKNIN